MRPRRTCETGTPPPCLSACSQHTAAVYKLADGSVPAQIWRGFEQLADFMLEVTRTGQRSGLLMDLGSLASDQIGNHFFPGEAQRGFLQRLCRRHHLADAGRLELPLDPVDRAARGEGVELDPVLDQELD